MPKKARLDARDLATEIIRRAAAAAGNDCSYVVHLSDPQKRASGCTRSHPHFAPSNRDHAGEMSDHRGVARTICAASLVRLLFAVRNASKGTLAPLAKSPAHLTRK